MNAEIIVLIVIYFGLLYFLGVQIGEQNYNNAVIAVIVCIGLFFLIRVSKKARFESVLLVGLVIGYMCGGRGFAYFSVFGVFVGEFLMVLIFSLIFMRIFTGEMPIVKHKIFIPILIFSAYGSIRFMVFDLTQYIGNTGALITSLRDFAMIYYAIFFIYAYMVCRHKPSFDFVIKSMIVAIYLSFFKTFIEFAYPPIEWKLPYAFRVKDTKAFTCIAGIIYFSYAAYNFKKYRFFHFVFSLMSIGMLFMTEARTGYVAFFVCIILLLFSGSIKYFIFQLAILGVIGTISFIIVFSGLIDNPDSKVVSSVHHVVSLFDWENKLDLKDQDAQTTNEWRMLWWKTIFDEVHSSSKNLLFGNGFGYHLGANFAEEMLRELFNFNEFVQGTVGDKYEARSPHNFLITVIGRLGYIGIFLYSFVLFFMILLVLNASKVVRRKEVHFYYLMFALMAFSLMIQSWFSIVLEGPYGAIIFWSLLGIAVQKKENFNDIFNINTYNPPINLHYPHNVDPNQNVINAQNTK